MTTFIVDSKYKISSKSCESFRRFKMRTEGQTHHHAFNPRTSRNELIITPQKQCGEIDISVPLFQQVQDSNRTREVIDFGCKPQHQRSFTQ